MTNNSLMTVNKEIINKDNIFKIDTSKINDNTLLSLIEQTKADYQVIINEYDGMRGLLQKPPQNILDNFKVISDKLWELYDTNNNLTNDELLELVLKPKPIIIPPQTEPSKKTSRFNKMSEMWKKGHNSLSAAYHKPFSNRLLNMYTKRGGKYTNKGKSNKRKSNKRKSNKRKTNKKRYSSLKL